jgi:hypothetical protein
MKSLARPSFFRMFDLLLSTTNPGSKLAHWTYEGVEFERERLSLTGPKHGLTIEIITLTHSGRRGWSLMVTKEYWWAGAEHKAFKNMRWARPISGQRNDPMAWLRVQEAALERSLTTPTLRERDRGVLGKEEPASVRKRQDCKPIIDRHEDGHN